MVYAVELGRWEAYVALPSMKDEWEPVVVVVAVVGILTSPQIMLPPISLFPTVLLF